jgi:hypothetical protein
MSRRFAASALGFVALIALVLVASATAATKQARASGPPHGVWTCGYIAAHPAQAAAASVSCSARGPVRARGHRVLAFMPMTALSPCARVPASGAVGQGVFAWGNFQYYNYFSYSPAVIEYFTYYVQKQDGTNVQWGTDYQTNSHAVNVGANYYRWGAQNNAAYAQSWVWCWSVQ